MSKLKLPRWLRNFLCRIGLHKYIRSSSVNMFGEIEIHCKYCWKELSE